MIHDMTRTDSKTIDAVVGKVKAKPQKTISAQKRQHTKMTGIIDSAMSHDFGDISNLGLITDIEDFNRYIDAIQESGICAMDTETTGLNPMSDRLVGICLYTPSQKAVYVPVGHTDESGNIESIKQLSIQEVSFGLSRLSRIKWVFHNAKFDIRFIRQAFGIRLEPYFDTSLAGQYLNENESHKLKYLHSKYVLKSDEASPNFKDLFDGVPFNYVPIDTAYKYASGDAIKTFELYEFQRPFLDYDSEECRIRGLQDASRFYHETEIPLITILADMEDRGILLDIPFSQNLAVQYNQLIDEAKNDCLDFIQSIDLSKVDVEKRSKLSSPVNLSSPIQLAIIIYDALGLKNPIAKKKERSTDAEVLEALSGHKKYGHFFTAILKYRELAKLLSTYIEKLPTVVNQKTGAIHASFNQYGAKTGRFSSSEPNLQNIPASDKAIRQMFTARPDHVFISCDYSQQEPRVLAHVAEDDGMIEAYATGKDLYSWIASEVYKIPYDECKEVLPDGTKNLDGKKRRNAMKIIVLGIMYGMGAKSVAESLSISVEEAKRIMDMFFDAFPKVREYIYRIKQYAHQFGFVQTVWGRKRRLPDIRLPEYEFERLDGALVNEHQKSYLIRLMSNARFNEKDAVKAQIEKQYGIRVIDNGGKIAEAQRQSVNSIIQGTSADITKRAMLEIGKDQLIRDLGGHMLVTVHDEIIVECPDDVWTHVANRMISIMIDVARDKIRVPMKVDCEVTSRWNGEAIQQ